jgi:hypothetical protein
MGPHTQTFLDLRATARAVLTGEMWRYCYDRDVMHGSIRFHPGQEIAPTGIMDALGEMLILDEVAYLEVFKGNQIARGDERVRRLAGEIFTLPLNLEGRFCQPLPGLLTVGRAFLFARDLTVQTLQAFLGLAVIPGVLYTLPLGISVVDTQAHINTEVLAGGNVLHLTPTFDAELHEIAVCTSYDAYTLNRQTWLCGEVTSADESQAPNAAAIGEGEMFAVNIELPAGDFVFDAPVVVLKLWVAFLAWLVLTTIFVETSYRVPGPISRSLPSLGIEVHGEGIVLGKDSTVPLQIVGGGASDIHPDTNALVANELDGANSFFNGCVLCFCTIELVFVDQHWFVPPFLTLLLDVVRNTLLTDMTSRCIKRRTCPQGRKFEQVGKLFPQVMRGASLYKTCDICGQGIRIGLKEQMNMVRLNGKLYNRPRMLLCHLFNDFFQAIMNGSHKNFFSSFGTENEVVENMMHRMLFVYVVFVHARILVHMLCCCQQIVPTGTAWFIPTEKDGGFPARSW